MIKSVLNQHKKTNFNKDKEYNVLA